MLTEEAYWVWFVVAFVGGCAGTGLIRIGVWTDWIRVRLELLEQRERGRADRAS